MADRRQPGSAASDQWRDHQALARFEAFLFAAVATVLIIRAFLAVAGYPQVGGNSGLHVAHVLWGGLLMGVAIVVMEIFPGTLVRVRAAVIGGIGFGLFIDEVGKFLTKDVNYFFKPAIAIMYAVFVIGYLAVREVLERRPLNDRRRLALAAQALSDLSLGQLDQRHRDYALRLLDGVDETSELRQGADAVRAGLQAQRPDKRNIETVLTGLRERITAPLDARLTGRAADLTVLIAAGVMVLDLAGSVVASVSHPGKATALPTALDTWLPTAVSLVLVLAGVVLYLRSNRRSGIEWLSKGVLVQLLIVQLVLFNRTQWLGLGGFALDLVVLALLKLVGRTGSDEVPTSQGPDGARVG